MRALILASTSRYRAALLARLQVPFRQIASPFDERAHDGEFERLGPEAFARLLAKGKAEAVAAVDPEAWILAADQVAIIPDTPPQLLHKPGDARGALEQLLFLSGREHRLITALCLMCKATGEVYEAHDIQSVWLRPFGRDEALSYIARFQPFDCVGSYRIEDYGITLVERVQGDDSTGTGIIGLPMLPLCRLMRMAELLPPQKPCGAALDS